MEKTNKLSDKQLENVTGADGSLQAMCSQFNQEVSCLEHDGKCHWDDQGKTGLGKCKRCCVPAPETKVG